MKAGQRRSQAGRGKPALVSPEKQDFLVDVIVRRDRANEGMGRAEIITMLETLCPNLSAAQCKQAFKKIKRRDKYKGRLTGVVTAQKTTTKRSGITVAQQYRWHKVKSGTTHDHQNPTHEADTTPNLPFDPARPQPLSFTASPLN